MRISDWSSDVCSSDLSSPYPLLIRPFWSDLDGRPKWPEHLVPHRTDNARLRGRLATCGYPSLATVACPKSCPSSISQVRGFWSGAPYCRPRLGLPLNHPSRYLKVAWIRRCETERNCRTRNSAMKNRNWIILGG